MEGGKHEEHSLGILYQEYKLRKLSEVEKKKKNTQQEMRRLLLPIGVSSSVMSSQKWLRERTMAVTDETLPGG